MLDKELDSGAKASRKRLRGVYLLPNLSDFGEPLWRFLFN